LYTLGAILGAERVVVSGVGEKSVSASTATGGKTLVFAGLGVAAIVLALGVFLWKGNPFVDQTSADALSRRAQLFWDLRIAGDTLGAYNLMAASYRRRSTPAQFAREGSSIARTGATVKGVKLDDKGGLVEVELKTRLVDPKFSVLENTGTARERWVLEDGAWYRWPPGL
jgi:hypothetical protein